MIVYTLTGISLLLALWSILTAWRSGRRKLSLSWHQVSAACSLALFIYLYGTWVYLSIYTKYIFGTVFLLVLLAGIFRKKEPAYRSAASRIFLNLCLAGAFALLSVLYFTGTTGKPETVALTFPLKTGRYFVLQGGKGLPTNFFHYSYRGAIYAIDIVKLNDFGNRANKIFSTRLEDYYIYNDTIYSPCDGLIGRAREENPDNTPPSRERGPSNTNQVLIETDSFYVFMAHLKQHGVFVREGDRVRTGQPLGLVGNSGFTLEPHLHIQAHRKTGKHRWYQEAPLYIAFDGRCYLMFETIKPRRVRMVE